MEKRRTDRVTSVPSNQRMPNATVSQPLNKEAPIPQNRINQGKEATQINISNEQRIPNYKASDEWKTYVNKKGEYESKVKTVPRPVTLPNFTTTPKAVAPEVTVTPRPSVTPEVIVTPRPSVAPEVTVAPRPSVAPEVTVAPTPSVAPEVTVSPRPTIPPKATILPEINFKPKLNLAPEVTFAPKTKVAPDVTYAPKTKIAPEVTFAPKTKIAPEMSIAPKTKVAPEMSIAPRTKAVPEVIVSPRTSKAIHHVAPTPKTTRTPEYNMPRPNMIPNYLTMPRPNRMPDYTTVPHYNMAPDFINIPRPNVLHDLVNQPSNFDCCTSYPMFPMYNYDDAEELDKDIDYMKSMYPRTCKTIQLDIEDECDKLEYEGSCMFDQFPDRCHLGMIVDRVYQKHAHSHNLFDEDEAFHCSPSQGCPQYQETCEVQSYNPQFRGRNNPDFLRDLIEIMLFNELFHRRRRFRRRRRWY